MREQTVPSLAKWPFFLGDALFLCAAYFIYRESAHPMGFWQVGFVVFCVVGGAVLSLLPFLLEYQLLSRLAESQKLGTVVEHLQKLDSVAAQIGGATSQWQTVHEEAGKSVAASKEIAQRMDSERKAFSEFMQKINDGERANLRLEVEKLRRVESDWIQVVVRMLDHVYALNLAALRSGQPSLIEQLGNFQNACRDAARRVGLTPFLAQPAEPFDSQRHQLVEGKNTPPPGSLVAETIASGYTFQGRLLRPALVRLQPNGSGSLPTLAADETSRPTARPETTAVNAAQPSSSGNARG